MVKKYETTKSVTGGLPRVPIPIPTTAAPNQISDAIDSDGETRTKWPASRSVRYGWRRRTTADIWVTARGMPGTSWVTIAIANSATTDAKTSTRSRWTGRGSRM